MSKNSKAVRVVYEDHRHEINGIVRRFLTELWSDGEVTCGCQIAKDNPAHECAHVHPLIVKYLSSSERRDEVVEAIVLNRRPRLTNREIHRATIDSIVSRSIPEGSVVRIKYCGRPQNYVVGSYVRLTPDGKGVSRVYQGHTHGIAISNKLDAEGMIEMRVSYRDLPQTTTRPQLKDIPTAELESAQTERETREQNAILEALRENGLPPFNQEMEAHMKWGNQEFMAKNVKITMPATIQSKPKPEKKKRVFRLE